MTLQKEYLEREKKKIPIITMWLYYVASLTENLPPMKRMHKERMEGCYDRGILVDHEE